MLYKITDDALYFYSNRGDYNFMNLVSIFPMIEDEIVYETVEQYLLKKKLEMFQPTNTKLLRLIMNTHNPVLYTVYNRKIQNINMKEWETMYPSLLKHALKMRLEQHPNIKKKLYRTKPRVLYYAHDKDRENGIGFGVKVAWTTDHKFFGGNFLGKIWMELRDELKDDEFENLVYSKRETKTLEKQQRMIDRTNGLYQKMVSTYVQPDETIQLTESCKENEVIVLKKQDDVKKQDNVKKQDKHLDQTSKNKSNEISKKPKKNVAKYNKNAEKKNKKVISGEFIFDK